MQSVPMIPLCQLLGLWLEHEVLADGRGALLLDGRQSLLDLSGLVLDDLVEVGLGLGCSKVRPAATKNITNVKAHK